jgi:hypothetical protein
MSASPDNPFVSRPSRRLYSVPRRYDLATLMAVTFAYSLLFGAMRWWQASPAAIGLVSLFVTLVGLGQALLFRGRSPRAASAVAGVLAFLVCGIAAVLMSPYPRTNHVIYWTDTVIGLATGSLCPGTILGYLAGTLVAGVFLVADLFRKLLRRMSRRKPVGAFDGGDATETAVAHETPDVPAGREGIVWATIVGEEESAEV